MIRVLHILTYINGGGAEAVVYNYYSHIDRSKIKFDIITLSYSKEQFLASKFKELGARIHYLSRNPIKRLIEFNKIISNGQYDIVHAHCEFLSEWYLAIAYKHGVKVRIMHSHIANSHISFIKHLYRPLGHYIAKKTATDFFACGIKAAISLWGQKFYDSGRCYIVNNAIDLERYAFSDIKRDALRKSMGLADKHVLVNVGRLNYQKNHKFIIHLFSEYSKTDEKALLILIGDGELKDFIRNETSQLGISDKVITLGNRNDVPDLLNVCDCFILPSLFEGLPVVSIESQANGLPIIMADTITEECKITDIAMYISLQSPIKTWINGIKSLISKKTDRRIYNEVVKKSGYCINSESDRLLKKYLELINR